MMKKTITKFLFATTGLFMGSQSFAQCLEVTCMSGDSTMIADPGSCGAVYNFNDALGHACGMWADMESGVPAGWTSGILGGAQDNWAVLGASGTGIPFGTMMYGVPHSGNGSVEYSYLQTPIFDATGGGDFNFDFYCDNETGSYDQENVEVSYDGGVTWTNVLGPQMPNNATAIQSTTFNISGASGTANTTVRFTYNTVDGCCGSQNGFFVDNVIFIPTGTTVSQIAGPPSGSLFPVGMTTVTYVAELGALSDTCSFVITVMDTLAPSVAAPADVVTCQVIVNGIAPTVSDDCSFSVDYTLSGATVGSGVDDASGTAFNPGVTTVSYVATDSSGNVDSASFTVTVNAASGSETVQSCLSYLWSADGNSYTTSGVYTAIIDVMGCDSVATLDLTIDTVDTGVSQSAITLTADLGGATYQWLDCDNSFAPVSGEIGQSFVASSNGNYAVEINDGTCVDTSACFAISEVGVFDYNSNVEITVFPNPTSGQLTVYLGDKYESSIAVLRDLSGKQVAVYNVINSEYMTIEIEGERGIYLLEITTGTGESAVLKVIKE